MLNLRGLVPPVTHTSVPSRTALCGRDLTHFAPGARLGKAHSARLGQLHLPLCGFISVVLEARPDEIYFHQPSGPTDLQSVYLVVASITMATVV